MKVGLECHSGRASIFALFGAMLVVACTYTPDQKEVTPKVPPASHITASFEITDPDFADPFYLDWTTQFTVKVDADKEFVGANVTGGSATYVQATYTASGLISFELLPGYFDEGTHEVKVTATFLSGSGSLAEQIGQEVYKVEYKFNVVVQRTLPTGMPAPTVAMENGFLTYRWFGLPERHLDYELTIYQEVEGITQFVRSKTFTDPGEFVYVDSGYVGGDASYNLEMRNFADIRYYPTAIVNLRPAQFLFQTDANRAGQITWNQTIPNAIVTMVSNTQTQTVPFSQGVMVADTVQLGDQLYYRIYLYRNTYYNQRYDTTIAITTKPNLKRFSRLQVLPQQGKLLLLSASNLYRYNLSTLVKEDSLSRFTGTPGGVELATSLDGQHGSYLRAPGTAALLIEPLNFAAPVPYAVYVYDPLGVGRMATTYALSPISNNGLMGISFLYNGLPTAGIADVTIDPLANPYDGVIWKDSANASIPVISGSGQYAAVRSRTLPEAVVYEKSGAAWMVKGTCTEGTLYFRGSELVSIGPTSIHVFDAAQAPGVFSAIRTFNYASLFVGRNVVQVDYDPISERIVIEVRDPDNYSTLFIYNVTTFTRVAKVKAYTPPSTPEIIRHQYSGGFHFLSTGFVAPVP